MKHKPAARLLAIAVVATILFSLPFVGVGLATTLTQIVSGGGHLDPTWSPDGSSIAIVCYANSAGAIAIIPSQGGEPNVITDYESDNWGPSWSPDSQRIAFTKRSIDPGIWTMNTSGGDHQQLVAYGRDPSWSPDGSTIAFAGPDGIELVPSEGGTPVSLAGAEEGEAPYWSPDGSQIVFEIDTVGTGIFKISSSGGIAETVSLLDDAEEPTWSRDGMWIAFQAAPDSETHIWAVSANAGGDAILLVSESELGADAFSPDFGPDGELVLVGACCGPEQGLWIATDMITPISHKTWGSMKVLLGNSE